VGGPPTFRFAPVVPWAKTGPGYNEHVPHMLQHVQYMLQPESQNIIHNITKKFKEPSLIIDLGLSYYYMQELSTPLKIFVIHYTELKQDNLEKVI
jgi:hypothetical protein